MQNFKFLFINKNKSTDDRAFTLVEMLMAMAVLSMLTYVLYTLFVRTVKNVDMSDWKNKAQLKMRTGIKQLNMDLTAASAPAEITISDTVIDKSESWFLKYKDGATDTANASGELLSFYICTPGKNLPDEKVAQKIVKVVLSIEKVDIHPRLFYQKTMVKGTTDNTYEDNKKIMLLDDVSNFDAKIIAIDDPRAFDKVNKTKYVLRIELQAKHPRYPLTIVTENTEVPLMVGVKKM